MEKIDIKGWKGKDEVEIEDEESYYLIREHRKSKQTNEVKTNERKIPKINVEVLWSIIVENCPAGEDYTSKYLARKMIQRLGWHTIEGVSEEIFINALWGGKYRAKYLFPYLYYPLKVLESQGKIIYTGRGVVNRIK